VPAQPEPDHARTLEDRPFSVARTKNKRLNRMPDTSPIRAAVHAAKMTTSPQPSK